MSESTTLIGVFETMTDEQLNALEAEAKQDFEGAQALMRQWEQKAISLAGHRNVLQAAITAVRTKRTAAAKLAAASEQLVDDQVEAVANAAAARKAETRYTRNDVRETPVTRRA